MAKALSPHHASDVSMQVHGCDSVAHNSDSLTWNVCTSLTLDKARRLQYCVCVCVCVCVYVCVCCERYMMYLLTSLHIYKLLCLDELDLCVLTCLVMFRTIP